MFGKIRQFDYSGVFNTYVCFISCKSRPEAICLPTTTSFISTTEAEPPPHHSKAIFKGTLFLLIPVVTDVFYHLPPHANSSVRVCPPLLCSQLWKQPQCHLWQHSFRSSDLTKDHIQEQEKQTSLITSFKTFPGQEIGRLQIRALYKVCYKREESLLETLKCHQASQLG